MCQLPEVNLGWHIIQLHSPHAKIANKADTITLALKPRGDCHQKWAKTGRTSRPQKSRTCVRQKL